jgi:CHAT domain-containing protein
MTYQLAQLNIAKGKERMDHPLLAEFVENISRLNALAEQADGFIWRLKDESGDALAIEAFSDPTIVINMSVWRDVETLKNYVYSSDHLAFMRRKKEWFTKLESNHLVLWWIPKGHIPTIEEAKEKLRHLEEKGSTPEAFAINQPYEPN